MRLFPLFFKRLTAWALLLALVWAAVHPAVLNAQQPAAGVQRVMVCTAQGMVWVDVRELGVEVLPDSLSQSLPQTGAAGAALQAPGGDEGEAALVWLCPWCQFASALEPAPAHAGEGLVVYQPYLAYALPLRAMAMPGLPDVLALWPPMRGPPFFLS